MEDKGKISFFSAVLISINIMVGAGIIYAAGPMTNLAGSISFLGWPIIGFLLFPVIWAIANAAQLFPGGSGFYHYCSKGINPTAGFIAQWGYLLGYTATAASLATVLRGGFVNNAGVELFNEYPIIFNLAAVLLYSCLNLISIDKINKVQSIATVLKLTPILMVIALVAFYFNLHLNFDVASLGKVTATVSTVLFAYWGFEASCSLGGFLKGGPGQVTKVILVGFFATMGLYTLFHLGLLFIMGVDNLANYGAIAFPRFLGLSPTLSTSLEVGIAAAVLFSWANSILGVSLSNITNLYNLAKNKLILGDGFLCKTNKSERPVNAVILHGIVLLCFITFISDVKILMALTNFGVIIAFALTLAAVFLAHFKARRYPQVIMSLLAFCVCAALVYYSWAEIPSIVYLVPLAVGLVGGVVMFKIQRAREAKTLATT